MPSAPASTTTGLRSQGPRGNEARGQRGAVIKAWGPFLKQEIALVEPAKLIFLPRPILLTNAMQYGSIIDNINE